MQLIEKSLIMGYQKSNEPLDIPTSLMIFQTLDSENSPSILSFASLVPSYAQDHSLRPGKKRYLFLR
jgi:hypothetical protein